MEVSGQLHSPAALLPRKEPLVPLGSRLGGPQSRSGHCGEQTNRTPVVQPVARRCTDWAIPASEKITLWSFINFILLSWRNFNWKSLHLLYKWRDMRFNGRFTLVNKQWQKPFEGSGIVNVFPENLMTISQSVLSCHLVVMNSTF
jgi:hypothetical protein